jgi:hypothetical protein
VTDLSSDLIPVALLRVPVPLWARSQEHTDELLREFTLIAARLHDQPGSAEVPVRLVELIEELTRQYGGLNTNQEHRLAEADAAGVAEIDLTYLVPMEVAEASKALGAILDEADDYCRAGQHLLTLATPPELVRFRRWFLDEFVSQLTGAAPTLFPDYQG